MYKRMKRRELEKKLKSMGWLFLRHGGRHDVWTNGSREIPLPRHAEINEYTAHNIIKQAKEDQLCD
jgi:mRNA interferase HicA